MKIEALLDTPAILANQAAPVHLAIRFTAHEIPGGRDKPVAFAAVIDRSGSMAGEPLHAAKEAAKLVVKKLRTGDLFGLVVFDDSANTVVPLQPIGDRQQVINQIDAIQDGGSTNLTAGWTLGRDELRKAPAGVQRRLLLLSDGQLNSGIIEPTMVLQIVGKGLESDAVRTSCLGFGDSYNEDLMAGMARVTNGAFYDATSAEKLPQVFAAELDGLQNLAIQNLRLRIKRLDFCEDYIVFANYPHVRLPDGRLELNVGDLVSTEERTLIVLIKVMPLPMLPSGTPVADLAGVALLELEAAYDLISKEGISSVVWTQTVRVVPVQDPAEVRTNSEVIPWVAAQRAGKAIADAIEASDSGRPEEAKRRLQDEIVALDLLGDQAATEESRALIRESLRKLEEFGTFNVQERKRQGYVAYSMRRMSSSEVWSAESPAPSFKSPRQPPRDPNKSAPKDPRQP